MQILSLFWESLWMGSASVCHDGDILLIGMFLSLPLTMMSPSLSRVAVSPSFISTVIFVLSRCLVFKLREMWHVATCRLWCILYIKICILVTQCFILHCQQHPYNIAKFACFSLYDPNHPTLPLTRYIVNVAYANLI